MKGILFADVDVNATAQVAEESKKLATNSNYRAIGTKVDVTSAQSVQDIVDLAMKEFGRIDYCVNAAGVNLSPLSYLPSLPSIPPSSET